MNRLTIMSGVILLVGAGLALAQDNANPGDQAAPWVGSLNLPNVHGLGFVADDGSETAIALQVVATARSPEEVKPMPLPEDLAARVQAVEPGRYVREEWDKGAALRDNWSARWTGTLQVEKEGEYTFYLTTDDGARLRIDGELLIDFWQPRSPSASEVKVNLTAGEHAIVVEFFEAGGGAVARLEWSAEGLDRQVVPPERVTHDGQPGWEVAYFSNPNLEGDPVRVEPVERIDTDWGDGGPRVGEEEPGPVTLEWTCDQPGHVVGRVRAGAGTHIGLLPWARLRRPEAGAAGGGWTLSVHPVGKTAEGEASPSFRGSGLWFPPAESPWLFEATLRSRAGATGDHPRATPEAVRQALRDAFQAGRKPNLPRLPPDAEGWISLFNERDLSGWKMRNPGAPNHWRAENGWLRNIEGGGSDLYTEWTFTDFDLHVEFRVPPGSNSGVYLQGIYEIQVDDCFGQDLRNTMCGAVYGKITPSVNAAKPAGEWQTFDINFRAATLDDDGQIVPARVSVVFNGVKTIEEAEIHGVTGGAMSDRILEPGPLMFQGDHGPVDYRNVKIRPR